MSTLAGIAHGRPGRAAGLGDGLALLGCGLLIAAYVPVLLIRWQQPQTLQDFSVAWIAGRLALSGKAALAYDWPSLSGPLFAAFGTAHAGFVRAFFYPPILLLAMAPLSLLPFGAAAAVWLGTTLAAYLAAMRAIVPGTAATVAALAAPVVLFNFSLGQNGLLSAGLLGGALALLDASPVASGVLIGLLAYKPHFGLLLPLFLAATGRWRVFASATLTLAGLVGLTALLFGPQVFLAFLRVLPTAANDVQHKGVGQMLGWGDMESVYGGLRALGAGNGIAWAAHAVVAIAAAAASLRIAAGGAPQALKAAALALAAFLVPPYSQLNDVAVLMVPCAFLVRDGLANGMRPAEKLALATVYLLPLLYLFWRVIVDSLGFPGLVSRSGVVGPLMCVLLAAVVAGRLRRPSPPAAIR